MTTKEVSTLLQREHVRKSGGVFTYWVSYFWGVHRDADALVNHVKTKIPSARILDSGNHFHAFNGGAKSGSSKDSYLWVKFTVSDADMPVSADKVTSRFLRGDVTTADLMAM
jgi:hypothetical protein